MRPHPRWHRFDWRRLLPELFEPTDIMSLGFDEPLDDLPAIVALLDDAIEQLYEGRRRVCPTCGAVARRHEP